MTLPFSTSLDLEVVAKGIEFTKAAHAGQKRWDGSDYYIHCVQVANRALGHGYISTEVALVGLFHDAVEDTSVTLTRIEDAYGYQVAACVDLLSQRPGETREAYFGRCMAYGGDTVLAVKFADRVENLRTISTVPALDIYKDHVQNYFYEVEHYFLPYLHRVKPSLAAELVNVTARAVSYFKTSPQAPLLRFPVLPDLTLAS